MHSQRNIKKMSGTLRSEVWRNLGRVRSRKAANNCLLVTICQSVRHISGTELMHHSFRITELHRNTNSLDQFYSKFFFLSRHCCKMSSNTRHTSMQIPQFYVSPDFYRDVNEIYTIFGDFTQR